MNVSNQETADAIRELLKALENEDSWYVRKSAAVALGKLGQATPDVLAALLKVTGDENEYVPSYTAAALGQLGQVTPDVLTALVNALQDEHEYVRQEAAIALGKLDQAELVKFITRHSLKKHGF